MKKILYVEDDAINALVLRKLLEKNYQIEVAIDGQECLKKIAQAKFDAILLDINLGADKMDGIETLQKIRQNKDYQHTKVVAVTSFALPDDRERFLKAGFSDYISKPINGKVLLDLLAGLI